MLIAFDAKLILGLGISNVLSLTIHFACDYLTCMKCSHVNETEEG